MNFEIYCDEANPDVLTSASDRKRYLLIGGVWLPARIRANLKAKVHALRKQHDTWGEIKWNKVSDSRQAFFLDLVDLFLSFDQDLRFRCIAVDRTQVDMTLLANDAELGFYKFYYQLIHHWILDFNEYRIFCDVKSNRDSKRLPVLARCLTRSNLTSTIKTVQSLPSREVVGIQLCDLLLGAVSSCLNQKLKAGTAKAALVAKLEKGLGRRLAPTRRAEEKFNIFKIRLQGGW